MCPYRRFCILGFDFNLLVRENDESSLKTLGSGNHNKSWKFDAPDVCLLFKVRFYAKVERSQILCILFITLHLICKSPATLTHTSVYLRSSFKSETSLEFILRCWTRGPGGTGVCIFSRVKTTELFYGLQRGLWLKWHKNHTKLKVNFPHNLHSTDMCVGLFIYVHICDVGENIRGWKSVGTKTEIESGAIYISASYNVGLLGLQPTDNWFLLRLTWPSPSSSSSCPRWRNQFFHHHHHITIIIIIMKRRSSASYNGDRHHHQKMAIKCINEDQSVALRSKHKNTPLLPRWNKSQVCKGKWKYLNSGWKGSQSPPSIPHFT